MDQFDKLLEIFESQKEEIYNLSNKVNNLEQTNSFLLSIVEKSNRLPPIYDPKLIGDYKLAAIKREESLLSNTSNNHHHKDSTYCDLTLNASFDDSLVSNPNEVFEKSDKCLSDFIQEIIVNKTLSKSDQTHVISNHKDDVISTNRCCRNSMNLPVQYRSKSPIQNRNRNIFKRIFNKDCNDNKRLSKIQTSNDSYNDELFQTVISKIGINQSETTNNTANCHYFPKTTTAPIPSKSTSIKIQKSLDQSNKICQLSYSPNDLKINDNLCKALDYVIEVLKTHTGTLVDGTLVNNNTSNCHQTQSQIDDLGCSYNSLSKASLLDKLMTEKDIYMKTGDDHNKLKLLLTTQQIKADLLHQTLASQQQLISDRSLEIIQEQDNSSNLLRFIDQVDDDIIQLNREQKLLHNIESTTASTSFDSAEASTSNSAMKENSPSIISDEIKVKRQTELSRINKPIKNIEIDEKSKQGFIKFTALIKGYLVRILLQTDRVRNIIITIKDTAQMALSIRQEHLSGDCRQAHEVLPSASAIYQRRTQQEAFSFQNRLGAQLRTALRELHDIFFEWSSIDRMLLIQRHIDRLITVATSQIANQNEVDPEYFDANSTTKLTNSVLPSLKKSAPPTSATIKRRQNLANRQSAGNVKKAISSAAGVKTKSFSRRGRNNGNSSTAGKSPTGQPSHSISQTDRSRRYIAATTKSSCCPTKSNDKSACSSVYRSNSISSRRSTSRNQRNQPYLKNEPTENIQPNKVIKPLPQPIHPVSSIERHVSNTEIHANSSVARSSQSHQVVAGTVAPMLSVHKSAVPKTTPTSAAIPTPSAHNQLQQQQQQQYKQHTRQNTDIKDTLANNCTVSSKSSGDSQRTRTFVISEENYVDCFISNYRQICLSPQKPVISSAAAGAGYSASGGGDDVLSLCEVDIDGFDYYNNNNNCNANNVGLQSNNSKSNSTTDNNNNDNDNIVLVDISNHFDEFVTKQIENPVHKIVEYQQQQTNNYPISSSKYPHSRRNHLHNNQQSHHHHHIVPLTCYNTIKDRPEFVIDTTTIKQSSTPSHTTLSKSTEPIKQSYKVKRRIIANSSTTSFILNSVPSTQFLTN